MLKIETSKVTGVPGPSGWTQIHEFTPSEEEKLRKRGQLIAILSTKKFEEGVDVMVEGRELLTRLHEEYFGELEATPFNALKIALEKVSSEFRTSWGGVEIAAISFVEGVVYSGVTGGARVMISRQGSLATILESSLEGVTAASGYPKDKDLMVIATKEFFDSVELDEIKNALSSTDSLEGVEMFAQIIHKEESSGSVGVVVVKFEEEKVISQTPIPIPDTFQKPTINVVGIERKVKDFASSLSTKLSKLLPERKIYLKSQGEIGEIEPQSKKTTLSVGIVLLVILLVSIIFGIMQKNIKQSKAQYEGILIEAENQLNEAVGLAGASPEKARELFVLSEEKLKQIDELEVKDDRVEALRQKIQSQREAILGVYSSEAGLFLDLSLLSSGFKGDSIASSGDVIFVLDRNSKKIVSIETETKKSKVAASSDELSSPISISSYEDRVFVLEEDGVYEVTDGRESVIEKSWDEEVLISAYAGNFYILDKSQGAIYRYAGSDSGFGSRQDWLSASTKPDFSQAKSFVIDGSMYVLTNTGKVVKFSLGSPQSFGISGVFPEITTIDAIYTNEENEFVYLLDKNGKRVVVLDKKGAYKAQYASDKIQDTAELVVSEKDKKIILLSGDKLYSIDLKHI